MNPLVSAIAAAGRSNLERGLAVKTTLPSANGALRTARPTTAAALLAAGNQAAAAPQALARILKPGASQRWMLPQLSAITPQYIEGVLRGGLSGGHVQSWELFKLMEDSWPELAACVQELKNAVMRKTAVFEPYCEEDEEPTPEAVEKAKLVSTALRRMTPDPGADENGLYGMQFDILDAWFKGLSVQEIDWSNAEGDLNIIRAGKLGDITAPRATVYIPAHQYAWGMDGKLGLRLNAPGSGVPTYTTAWQPSATEVTPFPEHKFIIALNKATSGSALETARLRALAWWWCAANFSADWLMNLAQIFGLPIRWANYQQNAGQATVDAVCLMLENMGSNPWAAFPEGTTINLEQPTNIGNNSPQGDLLNRADAQARKLILGQTMSGSNAATGAGNGAGAFGKQEGSIKDDICDAAGDFVCEVINTQIIPSILVLNYPEETARDDCPRLCLVDEEEFTSENASVVSTLAGVGMKFSADELYKKTGFRKPRQGEETIGGRPPAPVLPKADLIAPGAPEDEEKPNAEEELKASGEGNGRWVTINGSPVFLEDGESVDDAIEKLSGRKSGEHEKGTREKITDKRKLKKITIDEAGRLMKQRGYELQPGGESKPGADGKWRTTYKFKDKAGKEHEFDTDEIKNKISASAAAVMIDYALRAAAPPSSFATQLAAAVQADLKPFFARLDAIFGIQDEGVQTEKLAAWLRDFEKLKRDVMADPASAHVLRDIMARNFARGLSR